jgi:hypothetical protein
MLVLVHSKVCSHIKAGQVCPAAQAQVSYSQVLENLTHHAMLFLLGSSAASLQSTRLHAATLCAACWLVYMSIIATSRGVCVLPTSCKVLLLGCFTRLQRAVVS